MTLIEMGRTMGRLESTLNIVVTKLDSVLVAQAVQDVKVQALTVEIGELKEREKFRARLVASAFVTALVGPLMFWLQVKP